MATELAEETATKDSTAAQEKTETTGTTEKADTALTAVEKEGTETSLTQGAAPELPAKWMAALDSDLKSDEEAVKLLEGFKRGLPDIAKAYVDLQRKPEGLRIPDENATPEETAAYRKAIGVPENPTDYKLEKLDLPDDLNFDPTWDKELREEAHRLGMNQEQVADLRKWYFKRYVEDMKPVKITMEEAIAAFRKKKGPDYEVAQAYKARAVNRFLSPGVAVIFGKTGIGNHPDILEMFFDIGKAMSDHVFAEGNRGGSAETAPAFGNRNDTQIAGVLYKTKE